MIEILTKTTSEFYSDEQAAIQALNALPPTSVRLDYHGVLDTVPFSDSLPSEHSYCVVSYVGLNGEKHRQTKEELQIRIESNQILFGILVFQKGYTRKEKRTYIQKGGKAWAIKHLPEIPTKSTYFLDDHKEHLLSTQLLCPHIHYIQYTVNLPLSLLLGGL